LEQGALECPFLCPARYVDGCFVEGIHPGAPHGGRKGAR
jgi:hypothetical protein